MLEENLDLIRKIVWGFIKGNPGLEFDDLFSEACLICLEAEHKYDPEKGKESTFIYHVVNNQMRTLLKKEAIKFSELQNQWLEEEINLDLNPEQQIIIQEEWQEVYNSLSPKSKEICQLVLNDPDIETLIDTPKLYRGQLARRLKADNWSWNNIWGSFAEIKQALS